MVLKNPISYKLTSKKQNLYKKFKACLEIFQKTNKKKKQGRKKWGRLNILIPHTEFFILGKIIRLKALSH